MPMSEKKLHVVFAPTNTITILGEKGGGKSNFCCVLMEALVLLGYEIWTNIHFFGYSIKDKAKWTEHIAEACNKDMLKKGIKYRRVPNEIHVFSTLSELMYGLCEYGTKIVFLDEAGIVAETGTSSKTNTIKRLAYIIRHFDACLVNIAQLKGSLPPALRKELVDFEFNAYKKSRRVTIGRRGTATDELTGETYIAFPVVKTWKKTPHTKLAHDSFFISDMVPDIDLKKLLEQLGKADSSMDIINGYGKKVIDRLMREQPVSDGTGNAKDFSFSFFEHHYRTNHNTNFDLDALSVITGKPKSLLYTYKSKWKKSIQNIEN